MANDYQSNRPGHSQGGSRDNRRDGGQGRNGQRSGGGQNRGGQNNNRGGVPRRNNAPERETATAPYNFVPLPATVLPAPFVRDAQNKGTGAEKDKKQDAMKDEEKYAAYIQEKGKLSGVIELTVETRTPFYIGAGKETKFFSPVDDVPIIPGSTMRGMVKNIMKILTCGAMRPAGRQDIDSKEIEGDGDFHDRKLYFRTFAAKSGIGIKAEYDAELMRRGADNLLESKAEPGFLLRIGKTYYIRRTEKEVIRDIDLVAKKSIPNTPNASDDKNCIQWDWPENRKEGTERVVACFTGAMNSKKRYTVHKIPPDWNQENLLEVSNSRIIDYQDDATRRGIDLFKVGKSGTEAEEFTGRDDVSYVVPCFFVAKDDKVKHFGFGRHYRVPYKLSISRHVLPDLQSKAPDFTDALFGCKEKWGSRIFFEDCVSERDTITPLDESKSRILATPNPTSFQLYLDQNQKDPMGSRNHWNSKGEDENGIPIRGYKLYWHKRDDNEAWKRQPNDPDLKNTTPIRPIRSGARFHGKIRFERLGEEELGALVSVFRMAEKDKSICFKLGRGKSIGMGSVRIDAKLRLINSSAYTQLFDSDGWHRGETDDTQMKTYADIFEAYVKKKLEASADKNAYSRYQISLRAMERLLNWQTTRLPGWERETKTMTIGGRGNLFTERVILPDVDGVIRLANTRNNP